MRNVLLLFLFLTGGCFYLGQDQLEDVLQRPVPQWSSRDCLTVVLTSMQNNLYDQNCTNIKVIATPYTPAVIAAINRMAQLKAHWSDAEVEHQIDTSLALQAGLYIDRTTDRFMDSRGNFLKSSRQLDVLQFLVTIRNNSWPCNIPVQTVNHGTKTNPNFVLDFIAKPTDWPCYIPPIDDIDHRIFLLNDRGDSLKPKYVWGRRNNQLSMEETLIVKFELRQSDVHLFDGSKSIYLTLTGFDGPIRLTFSLSLINHALRQVAAE